MSFTNPIWLWGLTGLAIPLAIHLLSRKEGKVIRMGSLRYLSESTTQQFKSFRLNEILLLASRMLLISLLALLMSGLHVQTGSKEKWLLIEPGLEENESVRQLRDSLEENGFDTRYFVEGFPTTDQGLNQVEMASHWNLVDQLKERPIDEAVILSSSRMADFMGEQNVLPDFVKWVTIDPETKEFLVTAYRVAKDSAELRKGITNATRTEFVSTQVFAPSGQTTLLSLDSLPILSPDTLRINLVADTGFEYDREIIRAALQAIQQMGKVIIKVREDSANAKREEWLFWLSDKKYPSLWNNVLSFKESNSPELIVQQGRSHWVLSERLLEDIALKRNLTLELARILLPPKNQSRVAREDLRTMPEAMRWASAGNAPSENSETRRSIAGWLILAFFLTLITERLLSYRKNL